MNHPVKRIGVLTSGGDAPGMNAAIRAVVRDCLYRGIECIGIRRGYNGLINGDIVRMDAGTVTHIINRGGTILYTARSDEFRTEAGQQRAAATCKLLGLDGIVAIGGDGTFRGAQALAKTGVSVVGIPATIDNDIVCTDYTIGFDTASNTAVDAIDRLRDTMQSHERCSVVEVMGRNAGHLALYVGLAVGATAVLMPELPMDFDRDVVEKIRRARLSGKTHYMIVVAEGAGKAMEISNRIHEELGLDPRVTILGHVQRGGTPTARDRVMATRMGYAAVEVLLAGRTNRVICSNHGSMVDVDIEEGLSMKKGLNQQHGGRDQKPRHRGNRLRVHVMKRDTPQEGQQQNIKSLIHPPGKVAAPGVGIRRRHIRLHCPAHRRAGIEGVQIGLSLQGGVFHPVLLQPGTHRLCRPEPSLLPIQLPQTALHLPGQGLLPPLDPPDGSQRKAQLPQQLNPQQLRHVLLPVVPVAVFQAAWVQKALPLVVADVGSGEARPPLHLLYVHIPSPSHVVVS